jgi:hypothetical protein
MQCVQELQVLRSLRQRGWDLRGLQTQTTYCFVLSLTCQLPDMHQSLRPHARANDSDTADEGVRCFTDI